MIPNQKTKILIAVLMLSFATAILLRAPIEEGIMNQFMNQFAKAFQARQWEKSLKIADTAVFFAGKTQEKEMHLGQAYQLKGLAYRQMDDLENAKKFFQLSENSYLKLGSRPTN